MKKTIIIALLLIATFTSHQTVKAQITLEHTYDSASIFASALMGNQLQTFAGGIFFMVNFEIEGMKFVKWVTWDGTTNIGKIEIYNLDHSLYKSFDIPLAPNCKPKGILYFTEHLFNLDSLIEYMYVYTDNSYSGYHTRVFNELGDTLFSVDNAGPEVVLNSPQMMYPIYNTPNGAKMIISFQYGPLKVYNLPGKLPVYCCDSLMSGIPNPFGNSNSNSMSAFPNPSNGNNTTIEFQLPQNIATGEIVIYNMQGIEQKRYKVDHSFHNLIINNTDLHSGTYFYQLLTTSGTTSAKKMIIVK